MDVNQLLEPPYLYVLIGVAALIVALIILAIVRSSRRKREREALRDRYGSEYDRTVAQHGNTRAAVADLKEREELHRELSLNDLNDADRDLVRRHMASLQYRFVEDPADVMLQTDRVMTEVLRGKGYPIAEDRDKALRLFSVDHPEQAGNVRDVLHADHKGDVSRMRDAFLGARHALAEVVGISYVLGDATDSPDDLRLDRSASSRGDHELGTGTGTGTDQTHDLDSGTDQTHDLDSGTDRTDGSGTDTTRTITPSGDREHGDRTDDGTAHDDLPRREIDATDRATERTGDR